MLLGSELIFGVLDGKKATNILFLQGFFSDDICTHLGTGERIWIYDGRCLRNYHMQLRVRCRWATRNKGNVAARTGVLCGISCDK